LDIGDQRAEIEVTTRAPRVLDQVREQHVLTARERIGLDADEPEEARDRPFDLVSNRLGLGLEGEPRDGERADDVQRQACLRAGRVHQHLGGLTKRCDALPVDAARGEPLPPLRRDRCRVLVDGHAGRLGVVLVDPRPEALRSEVGERQEKVPHVALRIEDQCRYARDERFLEEDDAEAGLARARHPDDDRVGREVGRRKRQRLLRRLPALDAEAQAEVGHPRESSATPCEGV
jgi:hypothetical protein